MSNPIRGPLAAALLTAATAAPAEVPQRFWPVGEPPPPGAKLAYRPALVGAGRLHFVKASDDVDAWRVALLVGWALLVAFTAHALIGRLIVAAP